MGRSVLGQYVVESVSVDSAGIGEDEEHAGVREARRQLKFFTEHGYSRMVVNGTASQRQGELYLTDLTLSSAQLAKLMRSLAPNHGLTQLHLEGNRLTSSSELVHALRPLTELTHLDLAGNCLTSTPELAQALAPLESLRVLDLGSNQLESLPPLKGALSRLAHLRVLCLHENKLRSTPDLAAAISPLRELRVFFMHANRLEANEALAKTLAPLRGLVELWLHENQLESTPELGRALTPLVLLERLWLQRNRLVANTSLVDALEPLQALRAVMLHGNPLDIPYAILQKGDGQQIIAALRERNGRARPVPQPKPSILTKERAGTASAPNDESASPERLTAMLIQTVQLAIERFVRTEGQKRGEEAALGLTSQPVSSQDNVGSRKRGDPSIKLNDRQVAILRAVHASSEPAISKTIGPAVGLKGSRTWTICTDLLNRGLLMRSPGLQGYYLTDLGERSLASAGDRTVAGIVMEKQRTSRGTPKKRRK